MSQAISYLCIADVQRGKGLLRICDHFEQFRTLHTAIMEDAPPPPYEEVGTDVPPTFAARLMPLDFNVYSESAMLGDVYYMGPHQQDRQYALTNLINSVAEIPKPFLVLHDGLARRDPAIGASTNAWVKGTREFYDDYIVTAPPLAGRGLPPIEERLVVVTKGTYWRPVILLRYSVPVARPAATASGVAGERQEFEWQECSSREVMMLGGESRGWRLVALADESETLAVMAPNGGSLTKFLRFSFKGKGRMANHYGTTWEVMAVLTGLTTWHRRVEINHNSS
jgi:hypothetical protein